MIFSTPTRAKKVQSAVFAVLVTGSVLVAGSAASNAAAAVKTGAACSTATAIATSTTGKTVTCKSKKWTEYKAASLTFAIASAAFSPKEEFATYAVPKKLGYQKAENLTVTAVPSGGSIDVVNIVSAGRADIGAADLGSAMQGIEKNANISIIGGLVTNFPWKIAVDPTKGITKASDLKGKKIGIIGFGSGSYPYTKAWLAGYGLKESDVTLVATGTAIAPATLQLQSGAVDAIAYYTAVYASQEFTGTKFKYLPNPAALTGVQSLAWVVNTDKFEANPEVFERFLRTANKGLVFSSQNVKAATLLGYEELPATLAGSTVEAKLPAGMAGLKAWLTSATPLKGKPVTWDSLGTITKANWAKTQAYTAAAGTIVTGIDLVDWLDASLIKRANTYDRAAIVAAADKRPK
jgi:NitT/TauT family transport system substrate-binding protein